MPTVTFAPADTTHTHTHTLLEIDAICYETAGPSDIGTAQDWDAAAVACLSFIAISGGAPVGYVDLVRLSAKGQQIVVAGKYQDADILKCIDVTGERRSFYLASIAILPEFRGQGTGKSLLRFALNSLQAPAEIFGTIWTQQGANLLKAANQIGSDSKGRPIVRLAQPSLA